MTGPRPATQALLDAVSLGGTPCRPDGRVLARAICEACLGELDVDGAAVSVLPATVARETLWATDATAELLQELQFSLNDGLYIDAARTGQAILVPDLSDDREVSRWPVFSAAARERTDVRALFAFPLQWGAANLGVLDLYRSSVGGLAHAQWQDARGVADLAGLLMLGVHFDPAGDPESGTVHGHNRDDPSFGDHTVVHQATGMVLVQLGVSSIEALARVRAHAYAHDRLLVEVARDVVRCRLSVAEHTGDIEYSEAE